MVFSLYQLFPLSKKKKKKLLNLDNVNDVLLKTNYLYKLFRFLKFNHYINTQYIYLCTILMILYRFIFI
jgi:hypothetical protein